LLALGLVVLLAVGMFTRFYWVSWLGERVSADLRQAVFDHIIALHPGFFETNLSGEIQSRITTDTSLLQTLIGTSISMALRNSLLFLGGLIWMLITDPKLTGMVLLSVPLVIVPLVVIGKRVRKLSRYSQDKLADVGGFVGEALKNIKIVQAFNHQQTDRERFASQVEAAFTTGIQRIKQRAWLTAMVIILVFGAIVAMLWVGGQDVLAGRSSAGELTAFVFYAVMVAILSRHRLNRYHYRGWCMAL
jgi:ATP-binding cassette subfamily B protein